MIYTLILALFFHSGFSFARELGSIVSERGTFSYTDAGVRFTPHLEDAIPSVLGDAKASPWSLVMMKTSGGPGKTEKVVIDGKNQTPKIRSFKNGFELIFESLHQGDRIWKINFKIKFVGKNEGVLIDTEIQNNEKDWIVFEVLGPVFHNIPIDIARYPALLPVGLGRMINATPDEKHPVYDTWFGRWIKRSEQEYEYSVMTPGLSGTLQYMAFAGDRSGLYFGSPDPDFGAKRLVVLFNGKSRTWGAMICHTPIVQPGQSWRSVLVEFLPYCGKWHVAADHYRQWINSIGFLPDHPKWIDKISGMMLFIMKQQKGRHVMWKYDEIGGIMSDIADRYGFDFLALFGWAHGGHDHLYPEYYPDDLLGGVDELKKGIAKAHARGKRVYMYTNGQLMDTGNDHFFPQTGKSLSIVKQNGDLLTQNWQKFTDRPGFTHSLACPHDPRWFKILLNLAKNIQSYGADGILFDQVGTGCTDFCFSPDHGHAVPAIVRGNDNAILLKKIADEMKKIDPEFVVLTEGLNESQLSAVPYFHGCQMTFHGVVPKESALAWVRNTRGIIPFNSMFRYTYPEIKVTLRNPNALEYRRNVNYAAVFGLNHEIELRYPTDVRCVKDGIMPTAESYRSDAVRHVSGLVNDLKLMKDTTPKQSIDYVRSVSDFQRSHESLLICGRFVDDQGFTFTGSVVAKAFRNGNRLGIIVWNPDDMPVAFDVKVPNAKFVGAYAPGESTVSDPFRKLDKDSIRLLVWECDKIN